MFFTTRKSRKNWTLPKIHLKDGEKQKDPCVSTSAFWQIPELPDDPKQKTGEADCSLSECLQQAQIPFRHAYWERQQKRKSLRGESKCSCKPGRPGKRIHEHIKRKTGSLCKFSSPLARCCPGPRMMALRACFSRYTEPGLQRQTTGLLPNAPTLHLWAWCSTFLGCPASRIRPKACSAPGTLWFRHSPSATGGSRRLQYTGTDFFTRCCSLPISEGNRELFLLRSFRPGSSRSLLRD